MKFALLLWPAILAGCMHAGLARPPKTETVVIPVPTRAAEKPISDPAASYPAEYEQYYVGMIADYEDPTFAYAPGVLNVRRRAERPRLLAEPAVFDRGPVTAARMANDHPEAVPAEVASHLYRAQRAIASLTEQNEVLLTRVQELEKSKAAPAEAAPPAVAASPAASEPALNTLVPNAENVIELDPALLGGGNSGNPFVQLYVPKNGLREVALVVSAAFPGPNPTAVLNDRTLGIGDVFETLVVERIEADRVLLRKDAFLLACPVSEKPLKLRLPQ